MHDLNASERQMALTEVFFFKNRWPNYSELNMLGINASERQMALNEVLFKNTWPYYSKR